MKKPYRPGLALCALALSSLACGQTPAPGLATLKVQGDEFSSTCTTQNKAALKTELMLQIAEKKESASAWTLIETLLCEKKNARSSAYIGRHIDKTVTYATTSNGSPDTLTRTITNAELIASLPSEGAAWDTNLQFDGKTILINYMANEACIHSRTIRYDNGKWKLAAFAEACD